MTVKYDLKRPLQLCYLALLLTVFVAVWLLGPEEKGDYPLISALVVALLSSLPLWPFAWVVWRPSSRGLILFSFSQMLFFALAAAFAAGPDSRLWGIGISLLSALLLTLTIGQLGHYKWLSKQKSALR